MTTYKFIDGAYFEKCLTAYGEKWLGGAPEFAPGNVQGNAQKVFYYDALPIPRKNELDVDFELRRRKKMDFFAYLKKFQGWHVIHGIAKRNRGLEAQQKEVDVLLAVDMLTHAHRRNMTHVDFIAGDLDFRPLTDAVVREGIFVTLEYDPEHAASDLVDTCDAREPWDYWSVVRLLKASFLVAHPPASRNISDPNIVRQHCIVLERATREGQCVAELMLSSQDQRLYIIATEVSETTKVTGAFRHHMSHMSDVALLKRLWDAYVEKVEWTTA